MTTFICFSTRCSAFASAFFRSSQLFSRRTEMKKFEFSLSHMRDYKERLLDEEKGALQRVKSERDAIVSEMGSLVSSPSTSTV